MSLLDDPVTVGLELRLMAGGTFDDTEHLTDLGNARRLVAAHGCDLRYCHPWSAWLVYDGRRWKRDNTGEVQRRAKETIRGLYAEASIASNDELRKRIATHAAKSESDARIRSMLALAQSEPGIPVLPDELDADPWLFACGNGTVDLRTGELRNHSPDDLISRGTDVQYLADARCPRWKRFLLEVFDGDEELVSFVKRAVGHSITGDTREHVLFVCHGSGCNGKTTFLEMVKRVLGDLAMTAAFDSFVKTRNDREVRNDLARLHRARLVAAAESGRDRRLDEAVVKTLTGGDTVTARYLYGEHFEFRPEFKLWLATNHRPRVDGDDEAIWRRIRQIPFNVSFRGREDRDLSLDLERELPGILRWAVEGCQMWRTDGLGLAPAVERATAEYRESEDVLGAFIAERCILDGNVDAGPFRAAYEVFCHELGETPLSAGELGKALQARGIGRDRTGKRRFYVGISLDVPDREE